MWRVALKIVYLLSCTAAFGLAVLIVTDIVTNVLHERLGVLHYYWTPFVWPLGCGFGWWFAARSIEWHWFHYASLVLGAGVAVAGGIFAVHYWREAERLKGVLGPMSGFGEAMISYGYACLTAFAICVIIGSVAILIRNRVKSA